MNSIQTDYRPTPFVLFERTWTEYTGTTYQADYTTEGENGVKVYVRYSGPHDWEYTVEDESYGDKETIRMTPDLAGENNGKTLDAVLLSASDVAYSYEYPDGEDYYDEYDYDTHYADEYYDERPDSDLMNEY